MSRSSSPLAAPATLRRLALLALVANVGIVLSGGLVRVTGSGLGCPDWPRCQGTRIVPAAAEGEWHQFVEFGNRLLTFVVLAAAVAVYLSARRAAADRPEVRRPAALLPLGVLGQAVLGGVTVLTGLHPLIVAAHFLLSMLLIAVAVVLHHRVRDGGAVGALGAGPSDAGRRGPAARHGAPPVRRLATGLVALGAVVLVLGTLVTATGPHAGDPGTQRLALDIRTVARVHAGAVWVTVATTVALVVLALRERDTGVWRAAGLLLAVEVVQGSVGYTQYLLGIPEQLVAVHLLLASLFWVAVVRVALVARAPRRAPQAAPEPPAAVGPVRA